MKVNKIAAIHSRLNFKVIEIQLIQITQSCGKEENKVAVKKYHKENTTTSMKRKSLVVSKIPPLFEALSSIH